MKIEKYYYAELIARLDAEKAYEEERKSQMTSEQLEVEQLEKSMALEALWKEADTLKDLQPLTINREKKSAFEEIASLALEYARYESLNISVDFDRGAFGVITMETSYLMANRTDRKWGRNIIPYLMSCADEYSITAGNNGEIFTIQFHFTICDEQ